MNNDWETIECKDNTSHEGMLAIPVINIKFVQIPDKHHPKTMYETIAFPPGCEGYDKLKKNFTRMTREQFMNTFGNILKRET